MKSTNTAPVCFLVFLLLPAASYAQAPGSTAATPKEHSLWPAGPAQSTLAAKGSFATISAGGAAKMKPLDAHAMDAAAKLVGKPACFMGTVSSIYSPGTHGVTILDFDPKYKSAMTAVVFSENYAKFPDLTALNGKQVLVSGPIKLYHGHPQIEMTMPSQLKIVKK